MRLSHILIVAATFTAAAILSLLAASLSVRVIEDASEIGVRGALDEASLGWAEVQADGLTVTLSGTAPSEAARFRAVSTAGTVVDAARVIDDMHVAATEAIQPPRFSAEILRNDGGISIIGLIPASTDRDALIARLTEIAGAKGMTDLLETADYPAPPGWGDALGFAVTALGALERSKVSVDAGQIAITAIADSSEEKAALERDLRRRVPPSLRMSLDIAAPRPVITPFTLRYVLDENGGRFDSCSAQDDAARIRILDAARAAGLAGEGRCVVGMGVPSPRWAAAAERAIAAVAELGGGSVTFSDADLTLVALEGTAPALFDRVVGELQTALPEVFALHAVLPQPADTTSGPPEFMATLSPEGQVQLRGRLADETMRQLADSYAKARFGSDKVYTAARLVDGLPTDWTVRVLAGIEALSMLENGAVTVLPDNVRVQGLAFTEDASASVAQLLSSKLGEAETFEIEIAYEAPPKTEPDAPSPEACEKGLADILARGKITFEPGSATIAAASLDSMNAIADLLRLCGELRLEIQGHTDSQGREEMNQQLSQARADSVLAELRARRILTGNFTAVGYGESRPIADNGTEEGREANRRIEFRLIRPDAAASDGEDAQEPPADEAAATETEGEAANE